MESILELTDKNFDTEITNINIPIIIDFWAPWCGPCKAIAPLINQLAEEYKDKLKITKVNIDENPNLPAKFNIKSIPSLVILKDGVAVKQIVGSIDRAKIQQNISTIL